MTVLSSPTYRLRVAQINPHRPHIVDIAPDADMRRALAAEFGLIDLPALRLRGELRADGEQDWLFEGRVEADVVQPCIITLKPVASHIDEALQRRWSPDLAEPEGDEVEMVDDEVDPLRAVIDMGAVLEEALALALPPYPRAEGAELAVEGEVEADEDSDSQRPFADLSALLARKSREP